MQNRLKTWLMFWLIGKPKHQSNQIVIPNTPTMFDISEQWIVTYCTFDFKNWRYIYWCITFKEFEKRKAGLIVMPHEIAEEYIQEVKS